MKLMVSVITAPRYTEADYLPITLRELSKQLDAASIPLVTADAYSPEVPAGWRLESHPGPDRRGTRLQMRAVFQAFIESCADRLLYFEDDVTPCSNLIEYARRVEIPKAWPLITFFEPRMWQHLTTYLDPQSWQQQQAKAGRQIVPLPMRFFLHTQCFLTVRTTVEQLLQCDFVKQPRRIRGLNGSDSMLRGFLRGWGFRSYGAQIPNLVTHFGVDSIVMRGHTYVKGQTWSPGADFDCLSLLAPCHPPTNLYHTDPSR